MVGIKTGEQSKLTIFYTPKDKFLIKNAM
ncbi:hypothetical protein CRENPOLYSF1_390038 [Crenothrix polyspora]|uniref:Uncharacterized protein n=1 Tax=Crenothrix polyspora TaxID=360316 RepID=A0A1R4HA64_9GAMM|nr:hypothetical protein CRENPOLYSF1_390038 [Crenothrix polyspora]